MVDIRHRIGITAPASAVYDALATRPGLQRWWTSDTTGDSEVGGKLTFRFGAPDRFMVMEVTELTPSERVTWRCIDGPEEWIGTDILFDLHRNDDEDETVVLFTHSGWREPVEFMHHCTSKWGTYLMSLKHGVETGRFAAFPDDVHVSAFD